MNILGTSQNALKAFTEEIFDRGNQSHHLKASESLIKAGFTSEATTCLRRLETQIENIGDARNAAAGLAQLAYITRKLPDYISPVEKILSISRNIKNARERDDILIDLLPELRDHADAKQRVIS